MEENQRTGQHVDLFLLRDLHDLKVRTMEFHGISIPTTEQTSRDERSSGLSPCQATWPKAHQSFKTPLQPVKKRP